MKTRRVLTVISSLLLAASWAGAEEIAGLPLHVQKIDPGVIRLWVGDHISSTSIMAFATSKGIVVVDTFGVPEIDTELYPDSWNVYDSLGEALLRAGDTDNAAAMYQKSLTLNPESPTGREALKNIKEGAAAM